MKLIRVINISNQKVRIGDTIIEAHKIKDFPLEEVTKEMYSDIASYASVNVVRAFEYETDELGSTVKHTDTNTQAEEETVTEEPNEEETPTPKRSRKK